MIASVVIDLSQGVVLIALVLSMVVCIVLGMGLPTTPAYIIAASVVAPGLIKLGVPPLQAHLFVFYFACIAVITPPVALASYTAAAIAKAPPMKSQHDRRQARHSGLHHSLLLCIQPGFDRAGTVAQVAMALATSLVGIYFLAAGVAGYFLRPLPWLVRLCFIVGSVLLIKPGWITDAIGVSLVLVGFVYAFMTRTKTPPATVSQ